MSDQINILITARPSRPLYTLLNRGKFHDLELAKGNRLHDVLGINDQARQELHDTIGPTLTAYRRGEIDLGETIAELAQAASDINELLYLAMQITR